MLLRFGSVFPKDLHSMNAGGGGGGGGMASVMVKFIQT